MKIDKRILTDAINRTVEKLCKTNYKFKKYTFPSGKVVDYQGYEHFALNDLCKMYNEVDIENIRKFIPKFKYTIKDIVHYYYPDIYITSENLIIEVKSLYTYNKQLIKNITKTLAVRKAGYNFEFWIYERNKTKIVL